MLLSDVRARHNYINPSKKFHPTRKKRNHEQAEETKPVAYVNCDAEINAEPDGFDNKCSHSRLFYD